MIRAYIGYKINSEDEDHLQDGDDLYIIGELSHKDIDKKMYLYTRSTMDKAGVFILEDKVEYSDQKLIFEPSKELDRYIEAIKHRFKENFKLNE